MYLDEFQAFCFIVSMVKLWKLTQTTWAI